jgi:hypothetical protein
VDYQETIATALQSYIITVAVIFALCGIVTGIFSGWLASAKGHDGAAWFFLGLFFGVIALLAIGFAPVKEPPAESAAEL